jgi:hypothetical protein
VGDRRTRTQRRIDERAARELVRDRERLASLAAGGSREHPLEVGSASVVEVRVGALACPQCEGEYRVREHASVESGIRRVDVTCRQCATPRSLWFRLVSFEAN